MQDHQKLKERLQQRFFTSIPDLWRETLPLDPKTHGLYWDGEVRRQPLKLFHSHTQVSASQEYHVTVLLNSIYMRLLHESIYNCITKYICTYIYIFTYCTYCMCCWHIRILYICWIYTNTATVLIQKKNQKVNFCEC